MRHRLALVAVIAAFASSVPSQSTLTVGPGAHPNVDAAIAAASPGDVVVVLPGAYPSFAVTKGVTIRPAVAGTVSFVSPFFPTHISAQIPPGQTAHLAQLPLPTLIVTGGRLAAVDCTIGPNHVAVLGGSLVVLEGCAVTTTLSVGSAIYVDQQSELVAVDTTVSFTPNVPIPTAGTKSAVEVVGSRFRGSRLDVSVFNGPFGTAGPAVRGDGASEVWLSDCTLLGGAGGCALDGTAGRHDRCVLTPPCSTLPSGFILGAHRVSPLINGGVFAVDFTLQPGMAVGVFTAETFASQVYVQLEQSLLLPAASAYPLAALVANPQGVASASWLVPAGPQFVDRTLWLQGFSGFTLPLQASPLVGGVVR